MTQSDKEPFWSPPENYSDLPDFDDMFKELMYHNKRGECWIKRPIGNDQNKLREFLKNLDDDDSPGYYDYDVKYEEWCQVYESLKDIITENDTVKKLLNVIEEMDRWRAKYPSYAHTYWENVQNKDKKE